MMFRSKLKLYPPAENSNLALEMLSAFRRHERRVLLLESSSGREWTGGQLLDAAGRVATNLIREVGVKPGDVVYVLCEHSVREILLALGILLSGASIYSADPSDGYEEERTLCELVTPDVVVVADRLVATAEKLMANVRGMENARVVCMDTKQSSSSPGESLAPVVGDATDCVGDLPSSKSSSAENNNNNNNDSSMCDLNNPLSKGGMFDFDRLLSGHLDLALVDQVARERIQAGEHVATYMLTSGSTGRPKVVPSSHENLVFGLYSMWSTCEVPPTSAVVAANPPPPTTNGHPNDEGGRQSLEEGPLGLDERSVLAGDMPLDHGAGFNIMLLSMVLGAKFVAMPSYDVESFWQSVHDHRVTTSVSSTMFTYELLKRLKQEIDQDDDGRRKDNSWDLSCLRNIICVGSKMAFGSLLGEVRRKYTHMTVSQCYGCTEIGFVAGLRPADRESHADSVGQLFPGIVGKVVDRATGSPLGPNARGELHLWSRSKFSSYRCHSSEDPAKLSADCHDADGFYRTGDLAHMDDEHRLFIHGRFKETLTLMFDWKILPVEIEQVVDLHPLVETSVVVGVPDEHIVGCDAPKAFVKLVSARSQDLVALTCGDHSDRELHARFTNGDLDFVRAHIYDFVAARTARPKHLRGGIRFLEEFPTFGLLNKIDRKKIKAMD